MNIIDYAVRAGKMLRKTPEGQDFLCLHNDVKEKYAEKNDLSQFFRCIDKDSAKNYFYGWDMAYCKFKSVLEDQNMDHRELFLDTAKHVMSDPNIKKLAETAVKFGDLFENIVAGVLVGRELSEFVPCGWKSKVRNSFSDLQIAIQRSHILKTVCRLSQTHKALLESEEADEYNKSREELNCSAYSNEACAFMESHPELSYEYKKIMEDFTLVTEVVKRGVFEGFWGIVGELSSEQVVSWDEFEKEPLLEIKFVHNDVISVFQNRASWLYVICLENKKIYFVAYKREVKLETKEVTVTGIMYPERDIGFFG